MKYLLISIMLYVLFNLGLTTPVETMFSYIFTPAQNHMNLQATKIKNIGSFFIDMWDLNKSYIVLYEKYSKYTDASAKLVVLERENELLRKQLNIKSDNTYINSKKEVVNIYPNMLDISSTTRIIDKGRTYGIKKGNPVVYLNSIIGIVGNTNHVNSTIYLLSSPSVKIPAIVKKKDKTIEGIVTGQYGTTIVLTRLATDDDIKEGDMVFTSNRSPNIPQNLYIGIVTNVILNKSTSEKIAYIESSQDVDKLYKVFVLLN